MSYETYKIEISELLCRHEYIRASSPEEAEKIARNRYCNNEIVLSSNDRIKNSVEIRVLGTKGNLF